MWSILYLPSLLRCEGVSRPAWPNFYDNYLGRYDTVVYWRPGEVEARGGGGVQVGSPATAPGQLRHAQRVCILSYSDSEKWGGARDKFAGATLRRFFAICEKPGGADNRPPAVRRLRYFLTLTWGQISKLIFRGSHHRALQLSYFVCGLTLVSVSRIMQRCIRVIHSVWIAGIPPSLADSMFYPTIIPVGISFPGMADGTQPVGRARDGNDVVSLSYLNFTPIKSYGKGVLRHVWHDMTSYDLWRGRLFKITWKSSISQ